MLRVFLLAWCTAGVLSGCDYFGGDSVARTAAPEDLMRVAIPGWKTTGKHSVRQIATSDDFDKERSFFSLAPALVIKQSDNKITLIVVGSPSNAEGASQAGHSSRAVLGAYWFEKQGFHWLKVAEQANFAEEGYFGNPGDLRQTDLGNGNTALAVENGSCWQGSCAKWLALYALGEKKISQIFAGGIGTDSENASRSCSDLLKLAAGQSMRVPLENYSAYSVCQQITGASKILPSKNGPGQLVIEYSGKTTSPKRVPISAETKATYINDGIEDGAPEEEYLVTMIAVQQKQVFSFRDGRYVLVKGKNPNPNL